MHGRSDTPSVMDTIHSGIVFSDFEKWGLIRVLKKTGRVRVGSSRIRVGSDFIRSNQTTRFDSGILYPNYSNLSKIT